MEEVVCIFSFIWFVYVLFFSQPYTVCISYAYGTLWPVCAVSRDPRISSFRSNRIGGYDSNSNRICNGIESGGSRLHVQCRLSCGSCVYALAIAAQLHLKWSCKHKSQLQTAQRLMFLLNSE